MFEPPLIDFYDNSILNNAIGVDGNGVVAVGNGLNGILLQDVVGTLITTVNVSGNALNGLRMVGGSGTIFRGNFVGTNLASDQAFPNGSNGISLENTNGNQIGEPVSGGGNIISGNVGAGIFLFQSSSNVITNNIFGLNIAANMVLPNGGNGILLQASNDNIIGGLAQNIIAGNMSSGVAILSGVRNQIRPNMIYSNGGLGIDLDRNGMLPFDGVTFNDSSDADTGANNLLNAPILTAATTTTVSGRVKTTASTAITVDLYRSASCDPSGFGEASVFLGSTTVTTNANGVATWLIGFSPAANPSDAFAATATDPSLNTSEFSQCITIGRRPVETLTLFNPSNNVVSLISTLQDPLSSVAGAFSSYVAGISGTGKWVMGDWDGDGIDSPAVYLDNGLFWYTNEVQSTSNWTPIWFGFIGRQAVAGRFSPALNDCLGVVDSAPAGGTDTGYALYYTCALTGSSDPPKQGQWLGVPLPNSQGFSGTPQFVTGDFNNDGLDSIAFRRGPIVTWTNVAPSAGAAAFNFAQFFGVPPGASGEGNVVAGDWDGDAASSFGLFYQDGTFQRRNDLTWNSGAYVLQRVGLPIGTPTTPASWRPGGSEP